MTAELTERKKKKIQHNNADLLKLKQTVSSHLTSFAAEITVTKSVSLLEHAAQHVFIFFKHDVLLNAQLSTQPFCESTQLQYATHGHNGTEQLQKSTHNNHYFIYTALFK